MLELKVRNSISPRPVLEQGRCAEAVAPADSELPLGKVDKGHSVEWSGEARRLQWLHLSSSQMALVKKEPVCSWETGRGKAEG